MATCGTVFGAVEVVRVNGRWFYRCREHGLSVWAHRTAGDAAEAGRRHLIEDRLAELWPFAS